MAECVSCKGKSYVDQRLLFLRNVNVKAEEFPAYGLFSASEFRKYEQAIEQWFIDIIQQAVDVAVSRNPQDVQSLIADLRRLVLTGSAEIPEQVIDTILGQFETGITMGLGQLPAGFVDELVLPDIETIVANNIREMEGFATSASEDALAEIIGDGLRTGENVSQVAGRVREWAEDTDQIERATGYRATTIARTESIRALNDGQLSAWTEVGVQEKEWSISQGACQFCEWIGENRTIQPIGGLFAKLGERIPGTEGGRMNISYRNINGPGLHPNCRCTLLAVIP